MLYRKKPNLDWGGEVKLAALAPLHVELEADEPVAADLLLAVLQAAVGLRPDVRQVDCLPLQVCHQMPNLDVNGIRTGKIMVHLESKNTLLSTSPTHWS